MFHADFLLMGEIDKTNCSFTVFLLSNLRGKKALKPPNLVNPPSLRRRHSEPIFVEGDATKHFSVKRRVFQ